MQFIFTADYTLKSSLQSHLNSVFSVLYFVSKLLPESSVLQVEVLLLGANPNGRTWDLKGERSSIPVHQHQFGRILLTRN